jgi:dTDP-4-amino-4,6-dideoxygalactose transaminase
VEVAHAITVPFLDLQKQFHDLEPLFQQAIWPLLKSAKFIEGPAVTAFEHEFARYCGVSQAVAVDSGTAALHLAMLALDIGRGDEVVCPTSTFIATAAAIAVTGARPVFVDADLCNWQMDLEQVRAAIGPKCKAVVAVHLYGQPVEAARLKEICDEKGVYLIEDAAQAHGARYDGTRAGALGHAGCFSFYPGKNLGAFGDGGAVTTNDPELAERIRRLRNHGRLTKYEHAEVGFNFRMDAIQAAALSVKLPHLDRWNERRRTLASQYQQRLAGLPIRLPDVISLTQPVHHLFPVLTSERDRLAEFLKQRQIESGVHYPVPLHLQPAFSKLGYHVGDFPVAESIARQELSVPIFPEMTDAQINAVCQSIREFFGAGVANE